MKSDSNKVKILHLEDQQADAEQVARILKKALVECEIKLVSTREQYREALETYKPEIIISDHNLPAFNSIEAMKLLKQCKLEIPFILVTGTVSEEFAVEAMRTGADDYILKDRLQRLPVALNNILEKYRLDQEKRKTENLLRNIDANSLDMICSVSEDGYILHVSAASEAILGYKPSELIGKRIFDFTYPEDREKTIQSANHVMGGNLLTNFENRYVRKDGSVVTLSWSARWDEIDRIRYGVARDVTEKNKRDEKIKQTETLLRNIDANSLDLICSVSEDGYFLHVSASSEKVLGYTPAELIGKRIFDFIHTEDYQNTLDTANDVIEGTVLTSFENRFVRKDGSLVTLSWSACVDETDRIRYGIARDVTEKNKRDEKIKQAETLLRNIDTNSLDVICTIDQKGKFTYVSSASTKVWGYTSAELIGRKFMDFVYDEDKERTKQVDGSIMNGNPVTMFENRYRHKNGTIVPILWSARWEDSHETMYCVAKDVTELKKAERAIATERKRLYDLFMHAPVSMSITKGKDHVFELANPIYIELGGKTDIIGKPGREVFPELESQGLFTLLDTLYESGETYTANEMFFQIDREGKGQLSNVYHNVLQQPYRDVDGNVAGFFYFGMDVTEQVLTRKKIEESEQRYRQIVETAQEGIWVIDEHDTTTFVNTKMCEILEYTRDEMMGKPFSFFMDEEGRELGAEFMQKKKRQTCQDKMKYISKTGKEIWTNVSANPLLKDDGAYGGALSMVTDITEQRRIEEENKKLSDVASLTVNAVIVADSEGKITWVNKGFERITEYTLAEVVGKTPGHLLQGVNTDKGVSKYMGECTKNGQGFRVEILNYSKSGRQYWLDIEARPLRDNQNRLTGFMAIEQDITERKKFETTLVRRDHQITLAAQIAQLGYWEYDIANDQFTFNDQFYDVFKTTADAVGGYTMSSARYAELFVHPDDAELISRSVREAIQTPASDFSFKAEHRIVYSNGEIGFISVHFRTIKDEFGRTIKNFGVNQDITERKKVELDRLALIEGLQNKNKDLQQFSYIVSHNLRAPIAKIQGLISVMESESEENKFLLEKLTEEAMHLDDVVKDINTIVSARKSSKEKMEVVSLETKFTRIKQVLEDAIRESKATIHSDFSNAPELWSMKSYVYSILYNLISNAIKYRKPEVPLQIEVKSFQNEKFMCLSVKDNGEGIDLVKNGTKVFGLYKRFHTGSVPGKGIGLNLVKTHAESLGGRVEVESELNVGTTFRVYIPKHDGKAYVEKKDSALTKFS